MTVGLIIGAPLRNGWNARHEAQTASPFSSLVAAVHCHFCPLGQLTTSKEAPSPLKWPDWQGFLRRRTRQ